MSPSTLASEVDQALSGGLDKDLVLSHLRDYLAQEIALQPLFGSPFDREIAEGSDFDDWWNALPREMKVGKVDARRAFDRGRKSLPPIDKLINITALQVEIRRRTGQGFLHPGTFLRNKRWEDSLDSLRAWGGKKHGSLFDFSENERQALDNDSRFALGSR